LAINEVNANAGIMKGQKLQIIVSDSKGASQGSVNAATKLVRASLQSAPAFLASTRTSISAGTMNTAPQ
jgi:hypothetical protein